MVPEYVLLHLRACILRQRLMREHGYAQNEKKIAPMMIKVLLSHLQIAGLCAGASYESSRHVCD